MIGNVFREDMRHDLALITVESNHLSEIFYYYFSFVRKERESTFVGDPSMVA